MALNFYVFHLFYKFKVLVLVTLCLTVLGATFCYFEDFREQIFKAKSMVKDFRKVGSLHGSQKEEKIESIAEVPMVKFFQSHCPILSPYLQGASKLTFKESLTLEEVEKENPQVAEGRYHPTECSALQRVAILIPYRSREKHLLYLLKHLHPFLQRQQLDYGIYIIHQVRQLCRDVFGRDDNSAQQSEERHAAASAACLSIWSNIENCPPWKDVLAILGLPLHRKWAVVPDSTDAAAVN
ncbi:beta- -galactosyltransferase 4 [Limosa lapponica baueri]|uniref:Beta--galactosyltransferase 4 n=1 Tax=Limosa lapponica baueri TaxID=1758121 RepID=A0A2I0TJI9_LIMLA|nr:beta- -galactosyltransferase 4 [Limosa lapponica baueri]